MEMHFINTRHITETINNDNKRRDSLPIAIALSVVFFSMFSLMIITADAKSSAGSISSAQVKNIPQITMRYGLSNVNICSCKWGRNEQNYDSIGQPSRGWLKSSSACSTR
jgi:hypothetical protein